MIPDDEDIMFTWSYLCKNNQIVLNNDYLGISIVSLWF